MDTRNGWGEGASPALYGNRVVLTWDHEGSSFIVVLDKATGRRSGVAIARSRRRGRRLSWCGPVDGRR